MSKAPPSPEPEADSFDVVVYGGVPCGIAAAICAARAGARVLLIEPTRHVGGLSTSGINTAESEHMLKWTIGGFSLEFYRRLGEHYGMGEPEFYFESSVAERIYLQMLAEAGVVVRYGGRLTRVKKSGARIERITLSDGASLDAAVFVDASYEGDLMAAAGVAYAIGRESREAFGEEAAGVRFDPEPRKARAVDDAGNLLPGISGWAHELQAGDAHPGVMNYNFRLTVACDPAWRVPLPEPTHYDPRRYALLGNWAAQCVAAGETIALPKLLGFIKRRHGKFELNNKQDAVISLGHFGGQFDWPDADPARRAAIYQDHLDYTLGLLHYLGHDPAVPANVREEMRGWGLHRGEFADNDHLPYQLYVREARRMRGQVVVTQHDVQEQRRKPDSIGLSSHFIDCHHVQRLAVSQEAFVNEGRIWRLGYAYQIPYRSLLPKAEEADNLLVPGAASFTHVAFCTLRLESVWMITGQAAGVAAAMAAKQARAVGQLDIEALQAALRDAGQIVDFTAGAPEKCTQLNGPPEF